MAFSWPFGANKTDGQGGHTTDHNAIEEALNDLHTKAVATYSLGALDGGSFNDATPGVVYAGDGSANGPGLGSGVLETFSVFDGTVKMQRFAAADVNKIATRSFYQNWGAWRIFTAD